MYTFSAYLKGNREGVAVELGCTSMEPQKRTVTLTTGWKRYALSGVLPARYRHNGLSIRVAVPGRETAVVWADALQFEKCGEPTEFEE